MIGKLIRMLVGRSLAKKRGYSGLAGAAAGLLAPTVIKHGASLIGKTASAAFGGHRREQDPNYLRSAISPTPVRLSSSSEHNIFLAGGDAEATPVSKEGSSPGSSAAVTEKKLQDPETYKKYDEAMSDLGDAGGAASIAGPAA